MKKNSGRQNKNNIYIELKKRKNEGNIQNTINRHVQKVKNIQIIKNIQTIKSLQKQQQKYTNQSTWNIKSVKKLIDRKKKYTIRCNTWKKNSYFPQK